MFMFECLLPKPAESVTVNYRDDYVNLDVSPSDSVALLKKQVMLHFSIEDDDVCLIHKSRFLSPDHKTLQQCGIRDKAKITMMLMNSPLPIVETLVRSSSMKSAEGGEKLLTISIVDDSNNSVLLHHINPDDSIFSLREKYVEKRGIPFEQFKLSKNGRTLEDTDRIGNFFK